jgi:MarR family transcriptional regulator, transcriptional regulator for hemolysin
MSPNLENLEKVFDAVSALMAEMEARAFHDDRFSELSVRQMLYLNTIIRLGHPTYSDLAKELDVSKPSVTTVVTTLIRKGYVEKVQDHEDLRAYHIILTSKAEEFNDLHQNIHKNLVRHLAAQLDPNEIDQLTRLLSKAFLGIK